MHSRFGELFPKRALYSQTVDEAHQTRAASFGPAAAEYDRGRPSYPADVVDWMIPAGTKTAIDLGAGTGKFTQLLAARGLEVTAVDPSEGMLAQLRASVPGVVTAGGTAEALPLPDDFADLVTAAQAWHWVDGERGFPEVARVLNPGGSLALVWNFRDNRDGWMNELAGIIIDRDERVEVENVRPAHPQFEEFEHRIFSWSQTLSREGLVDLVKSRSIYLVASPEEQRSVLDRVGELLDSHPELAGRTTYELPYRTHSFRARVKK
ncbi:MAG: putative methyltransferase [Glaciihabitans sp.]|nr:putative methyltransferase [Glaciihabitans sp.]